MIGYGVEPAFAGYLAKLYVQAMSSGAFGAVTGDVTAVTGAPATTFAEYAAGAAAAWRTTAVAG